MGRFQPLVMLALLDLVSLGGCALSPQVISAQPALDAAALPKDGASATIALSVADARGTTTVGYRGGVYDTATITMAEDMPARVQAELSGAFAARGFNVVAAGTPANVTLAVEIAALGYKVTEGQVTRTVEVLATIRARAAAGETMRTGEYRDTRTQEFVKPPSESENAVFVNEVLSAALQRVLADADLLTY
ncbi:MAG: hypothetical protein HYR49_09995 [Gammaproteobacteria bacterium]|nr:hypothetical protein [Gammaproteobacteria bacterium]